MRRKGEAILLTQAAVSAVTGWIAYDDVMTSLNLLIAAAIPAMLALVRLHGDASGPKSVAA